MWPARGRASLGRCTPGLTGTRPGRGGRAGLRWPPAASPGGLRTGWRPGLPACRAGSGFPGWDDGREGGVCGAERGGRGPGSRADRAGGAGSPGRAPRCGDPRAPGRPGGDEEGVLSLPREPSPGIPVPAAGGMRSHHPSSPASPTSRSQCQEQASFVALPGAGDLPPSGWRGDRFHHLHLYTGRPSPSLPQEVAGKWQLCVRCCVSCCFEMSILI